MFINIQNSELPWWLAVHAPAAVRYTAYDTRCTLESTACKRIKLTLSLTQLSRSTLFKFWIHTITCNTLCNTHSAQLSNTLQYTLQSNLPFYETAQSGMEKKMQRLAYELQAEPWNSGLESSSWQNKTTSWPSNILVISSSIFFYLDGNIPHSADADYAQVRCILKKKVDLGLARFLVLQIST